MADFATAGGHWYLPSGEPYYRIVGANGKERDVTLRDARKVGAVPSVTGIIRCAAAPQLERWKRTQIMLAALTLPRINGESGDEFIARVEQDWQEQGRDAADKGTEIHGAIEQYYRKEVYTGEYMKHVLLAAGAIKAVCGDCDWSAERSFASPLGYGGKTDLHSEQWVLDVKTRDGDVSENKLTTYDDHAMQLAAYRHGIAPLNARCGILYIGRDVPSAQLVEISEPDLQQGWKMFTALLAYWQAKTGYKP